MNAALVDHGRSLADEIDGLETPPLQSRPSRRIPKGLKGAPQPTELQVQRAILNYITKAHPAAMAWHVPNGMGGNTDAQRLRRFREGVRAGVPDLTVLFPRSTAVFIEVKKPGGVVSDAQADRILRMRRMGFTAGVAASLDEAMDLFRQAGVIR
jgi:hypothetical protein